MAANSVKKESFKILGIINRESENTYIVATDNGIAKQCKNECKNDGKDTYLYFVSYKKLYILNDYSDTIYFNNAPIIFGDYLYNMTTCEIRNYFGISPRNKFKLFKNKIKAKVS